LVPPHEHGIQQNVFGDIAKIPPLERELYELAKKLIFAETSIESSVYYQEVLELASRIKPSRASEKMIKYVKNIYFNNIELLKEGFAPETNNTMEQLFSPINSFIEQAMSFKTKSGLSNFCYNLFASMNKRCFNKKLKSVHHRMKVFKRAIRVCASSGAAIPKSAIPHGHNSSAKRLQRELQKEPN